ncbi:FUSC family protein [Shewanella submarina]|uniref:FUSC family membrane protein n=1 Tax=Shewanella submarina TaxID=2016376 RepID=A0ABV7G646_9GAMM|nr:FUSC family membrane protein [Shewanella submarina]MCL1039308.1 FUSC family protein [Shewanella submarina]
MNQNSPSGSSLQRFPKYFQIPLLRYALNLRANIAALSYLSCALPLFFLGHYTTGFALSLGSIACHLGDSASVTRHRLLDFLLCFILFPIHCYLSVVLFPTPWLYGLYLAGSSFVLLMQSVYSPRLGAVGFATVLAGIYTMLIYQPGLEDWHLPLALTAGAIWYAMWQCFALWRWPGREDRDLQHELYQELAQKLISHTRPLLPGSYCQTFVVTAKLRALYAGKYNSLQQKVQQRLTAGEQSQELGWLLGSINTADKIAELTRLLHFTPGAAYQSQHQFWLEQIHALSGDLAQRLRTAKPKAANLSLPMERFDALRQMPAREGMEPGPEFRHEYLQTLAVIDKLELINIALTQLESGYPVPANSHTGSKSLQLSSASVLWQKFSSQLTLKSNHFRHAVRAVISLTLGWAVVTALHLEFGFWTLMTSLLVLKPNLALTWPRLLQRLTGTIGGLAIVALMQHWQIGEPLLVATFTLAAIGFFHTANRFYGFGVFCVTLFVFCGFALSGHGDGILLPRLENTLLGVALPVLCVLFIAPEWQKRAFPNQLLSTVSGYLTYLKSMQLYLGHPAQTNQSQPDDSKELEESFKQCVRNDTNLFDHWLGYLAEPRPKSSVAEVILLCCHGSNIILRLFTLLNWQAQKLAADDLITRELTETIAVFDNWHNRLLKDANSPYFFEVMRQHQNDIRARLLEIEQQGEQLDTVNILRLLRTEVEALM